MSLPGVGGRTPPSPQHTCHNQNSLQRLPSSLLTTTAYHKGKFKHNLKADLWLQCLGPEGLAFFCFLDPKPIPFPPAPAPTSMCLAWVNDRFNSNGSSYHLRDGFSYAPRG